MTTTVKQDSHALSQRLGVRHVFAKCMEPPSVPRLTEKGGQKKEAFQKNFFLPLFFCQLGLASGTRENLDGHPSDSGG